MAPVLIRTVLLGFSEHVGEASLRDEAAEVGYGGVVVASAKDASARAVKEMSGVEDEISVVQDCQLAFAGRQRMERGPHRQLNPSRPAFSCSANTCMASKTVPPRFCPLRIHSVVPSPHTRALRWKRENRRVKRSISLAKMVQRSVRVTTPLMTAA